MEKNVLLLSLNISFVGLSLDSVQARVRLTKDREKAVMDFLPMPCFTGEIRYHLLLLGLMASALVVVPLGCLHVRGIQCWVASAETEPTHLSQSESYSSLHCSTRPQARLYQCSDPGHTDGNCAEEVSCHNRCLPVRMGRYLLKENCEGVLRPKNALSPHKPSGFASCQLTKTLLSPPRHWTLCVDKDRLHHCGSLYQRASAMRSLRLHMLAHKLIIWSSKLFRSLRATHVPGVLNCGADLLSRGNPLYAEWKVHSEVARLVWQRIGLPSEGLFAPQENRVPCSSLCMIRVHLWEWMCCVSTLLNINQ